MFKFWRVQIRDVLELILLPGLAIILPWSLCFRLFGWMAQWDWLYREATHRAIDQARQSGWLGTNEREWARRRRLVSLIDHADYYLVRTRSDAWLRRYVQVRGQWPAAGEPALLCTFHWGASMWALRHARMNGMRGHFVLASTDKAHFMGRPVLHAYAAARTACCDHELGGLRLDASTRLRSDFSKILSNKEQIMAVIDVPADSFEIKQAVTVLDKHAEVPNGLMRMAVDRQLPVAVFMTGVNFTTGHRSLMIASLGVHSSVDALATQAFAVLDDAIRTSPPSWHFWSEAPRFFREEA